jgi:hypothetical protein
MKKIILFALLLSPLPAYRDPAIVQMASMASNVSGSVLTVHLSAAPASGNGEVFIWQTGTTNSITSLVQTNVTWTKDISNSITGRFTEVWHGLVTGTSSATLTVNLSVSTAAGYGGVLFEISSLPTNGITTGVASGTGTTMSPTITPAAGAAFIVAVGRPGAAPATPNGLPTGGFTGIAETTGDTRGVYAYRLVAATSGSYTPAWTVGSGTYDSVIVSYLAPSGPPSPANASGFFQLLPR